MCAATKNGSVVMPIILVVLPILVPINNKGVLAALFRDDTVDVVAEKRSRG